MHIHWRSLLGFGFIFWLLLCLNEILGGLRSHRHFQLSDFDEIYDKTFIEKLLEKKLQSQIGNIEHRGIKFGWTLLLWNSVAFIFSFAFCSLARTVSWILWKLYSCCRNKKYVQEMRTLGNTTERSNISISKIPVMIKSNSAITRSSDTNIQTKSKILSDISCPNLLAVRSGSNISQNTVSTNFRTLFKNNNIFTQNDLNFKFDRHLENQCTKLREEMLRLQANSLKEHAVLSRKLDAVNREKRELAKQLTMAQKENRAAKQQLEELLQEKGILMKRLENATKEFKCNTKTKKFALAKLEEVTSNVENLKLQLEQVSRDKEILENKLRVLEGEYEKLQERLILNQNHDNFNYQEHTPERDLNGKENGRIRETQSNLNVHQYGDVEYSTNAKTTTNSLTSVSQSEIDMKKIQIKIKQLEKNLENFNVTRSEFNFRDADGEESDISLSLRGNNTDSQLRTDDETDLSENPFLYSPRFKYWGGRAGDMVGRKDQFAKIQALATKMHEKVRFLENIKERCESVPDETELDEYSSRESLEDVRNPERIVSSSIAFQNFLKSLHSSESIKRQFGSHSDLFF